MGPLPLVLLGLIALSYNTKSEVKAECKLPTSDPVPQVITDFGSKHLLIENSKEITRHSEQKASLYCPNGFQYTSGNYRSTFTLESSHMDVECNSNEYFYYNGHSLSTIQCLDYQKFELFESLSPMPDCKEMSLVVGSKFPGFGTIKTLAICFNLLGQNLKYVAYTTYPSNIKVIKQTHDGQMNRFGMDTKVNYDKSLFKVTDTLNLNEAIQRDHQFQTMFGTETFEFSNLIQDDAFGNSLESYKEMLNIVWLRALRNGSWRNLLTALKIANLVNGNYDVRVGVSGTVSTPITQNCNETRSLTIQLESGTTVDVPAFIWAHVRALKPLNITNNDEFVAVAYNSPFITNIEREGLCHSICDEITWLKNTLFSKLKQYPVYGFIQCCRLSDVEHKLDNFPTSVEPLSFVPPLPPLSSLPPLPTEEVDPPLPEEYVEE